MVTIKSDTVNFPKYSGSAAPALNMENKNAAASSSDTTQTSRPPDMARTGQLGMPSLDLDSVPSTLRPGLPSQIPSQPSAYGQRTLPTVPATSQPAAELSEVPLALRPAEPSSRSETNPFFRKKLPQRDGEGNTSEPVPVASLAQLSLGEPSNNPWKPALEESRSLPVPRLPTDRSEDSGKAVWSLERQDASAMTTEQGSSGIISLQSEGESPAWDQESLPKSTANPIPSSNAVSEEILEEQNIWGDVGLLEKGKGPASNPPPPSSYADPQLDDWSLIDPEPYPTPHSQDTSHAGMAKPSADAKEAGSSAPPLPPRTSTPSRQLPGEQRVETYQIKNINWHDVKASKNPRVSPILVQNANGPCPLVALVNALTLTTPAELTDIALVEVLRSREQISLELLLDVVFDELMSSRRTNPDIPLPDVTDLYTFLKSLHTGMNVNPRFVALPETIQALKRTSLSHIHPSQRDDVIPGGFENTREMQLYSTFSVPLLHGWLPPMDEPAYLALSRRAESYEDAQNLLFREEELEERLNNSTGTALSKDEQALYQDILTIKSFLSISATQLTPWGVEVITRALEPGQVAILFRNDHFSTLYRHPQTLQLLSVVTDAGYSSHDEVVWESLVDVNGERAEFFSGDFRVVSGASGLLGTSNGQCQDGGPASSHRAQGSSSGRVMNEEHSNTPHQEMVDRDLALALQLQEEEEERHRQEQVRRQRESRLSEQFIEQQGRYGGVDRNAQARRAPTIPGLRPRNETAPTSQIVRPLVPPVAPARLSRPAVHRPGQGRADAPPPYEQAQRATPYEPPVGHPSHPNSPPVSRQNTAEAVPGRGRVGGSIKGQQGKDCRVM